MTGMMKILKTFAVQKFRCGVLKRRSVISLLLVSTPEGWVQFFYTPAHLFTHPGVTGFLAAAATVRRRQRNTRFSRGGRQGAANAAEYKVLSRRPPRCSERSGIQELNTLMLYSRNFATLAFGALMSVFTHYGIKCSSDVSAAPLRPPRETSTIKVVGVDTHHGGKTIFMVD